MIGCTMAGEIPTPKWEDAPPSVRELWHEANNARQKLFNAVEKFETALTEFKQSLAEMHNETTAKH